MEVWVEGSLLEEEEAVWSVKPARLLKIVLIKVDVEEEEVLAVELAEEKVQDEMHHKVC